MDAAQFFIALFGISAAIGAPQLNIPGVSTSRAQGGPTFSSFPSRFNQDRNVEAEVSSISLENPSVSSVFRTSSLTKSSQGSKQNNGNNGFAVLNNRFPSSSTGSSGPVPTSNTQTTNSAGATSGGSDDAPAMLMPYSFNYNVADDDYQTYIAREEESDGETVVGSYSYVDPTGALITVNYRAGLMGYTETREKQENYLVIRSNPSKTSKNSVKISSSSSAENKFTSTTGSSTTGSSNKFSSGSGSVGGSQQLTTTVTKKKSIDQAALIAQILAALQPQISSIVDSSIDEVEEVTEEKTVTVQQIPNISSTFEFSEQSSSGNSNKNLFGK